jgi:hypothetical protein
LRPQIVRNGEKSVEDILLARHILDDQTVGLNRDFIREWIRKVVPGVKVLGELEEDDELDEEWVPIEDQQVGHGSNKIHDDETYEGARKFGRNVFNF